MKGTAELNTTADLQASVLSREFIKLFMLVYLPVMVVFSGLSYALLKVDSHIHLNALKVHENKEVEIARGQLERELVQIVSDLRVMAKMPSLREYAHGHDRKEGQRFTQYLSILAQEKKFYDQLRFLDARGKEIIRVNFRNGQAHVTPDSALQDKSDRYYFKETWALPKDGFYISALDLNIEYGKIETPWQPMLRVGAQVFDEAGVKRGVVIINYKGEKLLQDFRQVFNGHGMLLNSEGYWLSSPDHKHEWNFMYGLKDSFASQYGEEWRRIMNQSHGDFTSDLGMFTFTTIYRPTLIQQLSLEADNPSNRNMAGTDSPQEFWKIVSLVSKDELTSRLLPSPLFWYVYFVCLILFGVMSGFLTITRIKHRRMRDDIADSDRLRKEIADTIGEGVLVLDKAGRISFANPEAARLLGWSIQELIGQSFHDRLCACLSKENSTVAHTCECTSPLIGGETCRCEMTHFWRKDGSSFTARATCTPIVRNGEAVGVVMAFDDISESQHHQLEYQKLLRTTLEGFWRTDLRGKILEVNDSYCRMSGYSSEELLEMNISDLEASENPEEVAAHMRKIVEHGYDMFETTHRRKNGQLMDIEISTTYSAGNGGYLMVFVRDITQRKQNAFEQERTRVQLRELYEKAPCGYHSLDREGRIIRINQTEADWLGYTRDELIGRKISDFHAPSSAETFAADFARFMQNGHVDNIEVDMLRKNGKSFTVLLSATAVYDADGNYMMNRAAMIDITERKRAEEQQRRSDANLRALLDTVPYLIWLKDVDSRFVAVNEAFLDTTGFASMDEVLGKADFELWPQELAAKYRADDIEVMTSRQQKLTVERALSKGELRWVETFKTPILDSMGNLLGTTGFAHDITDRIEQEERRLVEVQEQRDVLVREVHHRIKNNLQGVVGLLRQHASDHPEMREVTDVVVRRIYSIAVIHGLQAQTLTEEVALDGLIKGILEASEGNVSYRNNLRGQVLLSKDEAVPIALVLNELVTNACKHRSAHTQLEVTLDTDRNDSLITIENHFEEGGQEAAGDGQGLALVNSLLPRNSAHLLALRKGNIYSVVLRLSPPVTINIT